MQNVFVVSCTVKSSFHAKCIPGSINNAFVVHCTVPSWFSAQRIRGPIMHRICATLDNTMCPRSNKQSIRLMYNLFMRHCAVYSCFNAHPIRASVYSICVDQYTRLACFNKQCTCRSRACESLGSGWQVDASKSAVIVLSLVMKVDDHFTQFWNGCFKFQKGCFKLMFIACDFFF